MKDVPMLLIIIFFVIRSGFEPETHSLEGCCSIQLSYGTDHKNSRITREYPKFGCKGTKYL